MYCKNCNKPNCNDLEGDFGCLGLPDKTTLTDLLDRVKELVCSDCVRPTISLESDCEGNNLQVRVINKGSAEKVSIEIYKDGAIYKTARTSEIGITNFKIPFGEYRIRAFDTYNFECSTGYINYSHQCVSEGCLAPIVTVTSLNSPPTLVVNLISLGETTSVDVTIFKEGKVVNTRTLSSVDTIRFPASSGLYTVAITGHCINGETSETFKVRILEGNCDLSIGRIKYDCVNNKIGLIVSGGSTNYEYSLNGRTWFGSVDQLSLVPDTFYGLYIRDKENTACFTYRVFNTLCECQLSFTVSEIQCNEVLCVLDFTYSELQCSNTLICSINGVIQITQ